MAMKKLLLAGIAALFLATGIGHANEFVLLLQEDNDKPITTAFASTGMSCAEFLQSHERNRIAGTWLTYVPPGTEKPKRIIWVGCLSAVSKMHCSTESKVACKAQ
jgi:hypothetical protein